MIDLTPEEFRALGYRAVDLVAEQLEAVPHAPVRQPVPPEVRDELMHWPLPESGSDPAELLEELAEELHPFPMGNISPRFFAWVNSPPAPMAVLAELLAAGQNASVAGGDHAATYIEHGVLNWLKEIFAYPAEAGALLVSGGSAANLTALAVMRTVKAEGNVRAQGLGAGGGPMAVYTSAQGHSCIQKAVELLGIGSDNLRQVPVDWDFRMDMEALRAMVAADRAAGLRPVCVVASAGTVNTGAVDPLERIADLCERENLWFHVDGAYGGFGVLAEQTAGLFTGLERADSLAVDPHKWLYLPVEIGCVMVKSAQAMRDTFSLVPPYLRDDQALPWFSEFGLQQTRGFRALKLWAALRHIGLDGYRKLIARDIELARSLQQKIREREHFELVAAGPLSVTCFRYAPKHRRDHDAINRALLPVVQAEGRVFLSGTELKGRFALRACIVNFRTSEPDLEVLLDAVADAGSRVGEAQG